MTRVLIIKTSSMGDIVHNLPVVADIRRSVPDVVIDWVVEEAYVDLVSLADGVDRIIPVAMRRWRQAAHLRSTGDERRGFLHDLRRDRYDIVLDTQGLLKSALVARRACLAAGGARVGFSFGLVRERLARLFYDRAYAVDPRLHAIERMRALAASALGYPYAPGAPRFDLTVPERRFDWIGTAVDTARWAGGGAIAAPVPRYAVLLHATARAEKAWPAEHWASLIDELCAAGITPVLPSGSAAERQAAEALATDAIRANGATKHRPLVRPVVAPPLTLTDAAALLAGATVVVGVDTGLLHLGAALDVPTVGLFGATPRWRYAPYWSPNAISLGSFGELGAQPGVDAVVEALRRLGILATANSTPFEVEDDRADVGGDVARATSGERP